MTVENTYAEFKALTAGTDTFTRVLWHLYKFFSATYHGVGGQNIYEVLTAYPGEGGSWDSEATVTNHAYFVIRCLNTTPGGATQWDAFFGATNEDGSYLGAIGHEIYPSVNNSGLYVAISARSYNEWNPALDAPYGNWSVPGRESPLLAILETAYKDKNHHFMEFISDGLTFFFGTCTETASTTYYECNRGCMLGYYKNALPVTGTPPTQGNPFFIFTGYPSHTNASKVWAHASPGVTTPNGYVFNYANDGWDRARLTYFYGQSTAFLRGRKPGTFVNMPIPIYGLAPTADTVIYTAGFTTMVLASSSDRAYFTTDGSRRYLTRISVPISGTEITW